MIPLSEEVQKQIKRLKGKLRGGDTPLDCFRDVEWPKGARFFAKKKDDQPHELIMIGCGRIGDFLSIASDELQFYFFAKADTREEDPLLFRVDHSQIPSGKEPSQRLSKLLAGFQVELLQPEDVEIPDDNLWSRLEAHGGQKTKKSLARLDEVWAANCSIRDLRGLEHCINLIDLKLSGAEVTDFTPLGALTKLKRLSISATADLSPLARLESLENLEIFDPPTLEFLAGLTRLEKLAVKCFHSPAPSLAAVPATLTRLDLYGPSFASQLASLSHLTELSELKLHGFEPKELAPFAPLTKLSSFEMVTGRIRDASPLAGWTEIQSLALRGPISDLSFARGMSKLRRLWLFDGAFEDLSPLAGLENLDNLFLRSRKLRDLSPLAKLGKLSILDVSGTSVRDLSPIFSLPLTFLRIGPPFQDWPQLARFPKLEEVRYLTPEDMPLPTLPETPKVYFDRD